MWLRVGGQVTIFFYGLRHYTEQVCQGGTMLDIYIHVMNSTYSTLHQASTDDIELQVGGLKRFAPEQW